MMRMAILLICLLATPSSAATLASDPPFAVTYWAGFIDFWSKWFNNRNAILFTALCVGALSIFIITRTKRMK